MKKTVKNFNYKETICLPKGNTINVQTLYFHKISTWLNQFVFTSYYATKKLTVKCENFKYQISQKVIVQSWSKLAHIYITYKMDYKFGAYTYSRSREITIWKKKLKIF